LTRAEVADLLRKLVRETQALQKYFRDLLLHDPAQAFVNASAIRVVNEQLAGLVSRMEKLARFAESGQNLPLSH